MSDGLKSYILPTILALLFHAGLVMLTATTWFETEGKQVRVTPRHINAELVDLRSQNKAKDEAKRKADASKKAAAKKTASKKAAAKKKAEAKRKAKQRAEKDKQRKIAQKKKADNKRKADSKRKAEAERLSLAKKKKADQQKAEQKKADQKKAEQRKQAEARRIADQAEQEEKLLAQERLRQQQAQQQAQADAEQAWQAQAQQLVASASDVIRSGVQSQWVRPASARNGMVVSVRIRLLPTGEVDDANIFKSSGDEAFDRSAVKAVLKAERFPKLQNIDPVVFDRYLRQIVLEFRPDDLRY
ncbi:MAG: cell envelope integrity protein TolA [Motiliproteus sp.]